MGVTIALLSFFGLLFGLTLLILVSGYLSHEENLADEGQAASLDSQSILGRPHFFGDLGPAPERPEPEDSTGGLVLCIQQHLASERDLVEMFMDEPSIERLYLPGPDERQEAPELLVRQVEGFVLRELEAVRRFVSEPSIDRLYGQGQLLARTP